MTNLEALQAIEAAMTQLGPIYIEYCEASPEIPRRHWMVRHHPRNCALRQFGYGDNLIAAYRNLLTKYDTQEAA
jgi:hypothetical protein